MKIRHVLNFYFKSFYKGMTLKYNLCRDNMIIKNLQGRSVRLDILAVDTNNRTYNIEIQRSDRGAGVKTCKI